MGTLAGGSAMVFLKKAAHPSRSRTSGTVGTRPGLAAMQRQSQRGSLTSLPRFDNGLHTKGWFDSMRSARKSSLLTALLMAAGPVAGSTIANGQDTLAGGRVIHNGGSLRGEAVSAAVPNLPAPEPQTVAAQPPARRELGPAPSPGCFFLNARTFTIPFTVDAAGARPTEVQLFGARGPNTEWKRLDGKPAAASVKEFRFTGDADGEFWFATRTIDAKGRPHPAGPIKAQLKVYVDTGKPQVDLNADADNSGRVEVQVAIDDVTPLNLRLRYVTDAVNQWREVTVGKVPPDGRISFTPPESWEQLSLQLIATDSAKNRAVVSKLIKRPRLAESVPSRFASNRGGSSLMNSAQYRMGGHTIGSDPYHVTDPVIHLDRKQPGPAEAAEPSSPQKPTSKDQLVGHPYQSGTPTTLGAYRGAMQVAPSSTHASNHQAGAAPLRPSPATIATQTPPTAPSTALPNNMVRPGAHPAPSSATSSGGMTLPVGGVPANTHRPHIVGVPPATHSTSSQFSVPSIAQNRAIAQNQRLAQNPLPSPASPEQITNGFALSGPALGGQTQAAPEAGAAQSQSSGALVPETLPVPTPEPEAQPPAKPRPKSAAEAMRPITAEDNPGSSQQLDAADAESIPTPKAEVDTGRYSARKSVDVSTASSLAPVRFSDSVRFSLEYEVEAIGSAGADAIELYGSIDDGKTWRFWGADPDKVSPFDIETKEEGAFGFRIVVVGGNGLTSPRPLSGETPDITVVVDQSRPSVRISGARYGEGDRVGSLVIQYECSDPNLKKRPIALAFSDKPDGPWTTIAAGLANDGLYVWPADPGLPRQMYLRVDATDRSGNVGTYILDRPIDTQGLAPRARIRGFQPLDRQ